MKILFVDDRIDGHHLSYFRGLTDKMKWDKVIINSEEVTNIGCKQYVTDLWPTKNIIGYLRFIAYIKKVAKEENVDIIHFLTMDSFTRFFGIGLLSLHNYKMIGTYHKVRLDFLHRIGLKMISHRLNTVVVHSEFLGKTLCDNKIKNYIPIEYPCFHKCSFTSVEAKRYFGIKNSYPVIGCIGGTRIDKGIDILLDAINKIDVKYNLLVSGKPEYFSKEYIEEHSSGVENKILNLHFLSEEEYDASIAASDFIVVPYRRMFNGASGPLGEGVYNGKTIIGSNYGNIGYLISQYHLGYTFECENSDSLVETLELALTHIYPFDDKYKEYQGMLDPINFRNKYHNLYRDTMNHVDKDY